MAALRARRRIGKSLVLAQIFMLLASAIGALPPQVLAAGNAGLQLNGTSQYVTFGTAPALGASTFTLETWFKRTGTGAPTNTSSPTGGGLQSAVALVTKGRGEADAGSNVDTNYFLGIDTVSNKLAADYEEGAGQASPSLNHSIIGTTVITNNVWHHAAAAFDGTTWRLFLDGALDGTIVVGTGRAPRSDSIQHAGIGAALTSTGVAAGFFQGVIDEARIWNVARNETQIQAAKNTEIAAQAGLIGAWHLNDGSGTTALDSTAGGTTGNLMPVATPPHWVDGFVPPSAAPNTPTVSAPTDGATGVSTSPTLDVTASDSDSGTLSVSFFGRPLASGTFALIGTQSGVASGAHATMPWPNRGGGQTYQWFATVSDGALTTTGPTSTFHTAAEAGTVLIGVGDIASCTSTGDEETAAIVAGLDGPIFTAGDNAYETGSTADFTNCYGPTWGPFKSRTRPVPGNHDWGNTTPGSLAGYIGYFGAQATDANGKSYYSYDIDVNWHVVNLDSECANVAGGCGSGSPQQVWLLADLAANSTKNVIAVWHKPRFSSGTTNLTELQPFIDALYAAGVDLAFVGHDHIYERFQPLDPAGAHDPVNGIRYFTIGTGGAEHHTAGAQKPTSEALDDLTYGIMKLVLHPTSYDWTFLPVAGQTFTDSGSGAVHDAPSQDPVAFDDAYAGAAGAALVVPSLGVLGNDVDPDTATLSAAQVTGPSHGTLTLAANGGFTYTPVAGFNGIDSFTYLANDGTADSDPATVRITVGTGAATAGGLDGTNDHVTFGPAIGPTTGLGLTQFTLELWFKRTGAGVGTGTGTLGIASAVPLISKGRAEADTPANLNMNYFLGIDATSGVLVADFEDAANGTNHPVVGDTVITSDVWHHAAATYSGSTWNLYLDGTLDKTLTLSSAFVPESGSIQHAGVGTAFDSSGVAGGSFDGEVDEVRIWNVARSQSLIQASKNLEIQGPTTNLRGRWGFNEGSGTIAPDSSGRLLQGQVVGGATWVPGFVVPPADDPASASLVGPSNGATGIGTAPVLSVTVTDPESGPVDVRFFGRTASSGTYTLIATNSGVPSGTTTPTTWTSRASGQRYQWFVTVDDGNSVATSGTWTFQTAPGSDPVFVGAGDIADCTRTEDQATAAVIDGVAGAIWTAGDNVYQDGTALEFSTCYDQSWGGAIKSRTRPAPGNHDWNTGNLNGYNGYFGAAATDANGKSYYSYDIGSDWHVLVFDSECARVAGGCGTNSPQVIWARTDLTANASKNMILIWHKPRFSSGTTNLVDVQPFWDVAYGFGAEMVLVGHDHSYERFAPMNQAGASDPVNGVRQFTVGTGGAAATGFGTIKTTSQARSSQYGILKLTLHPSSYDWEFLPIDGGTFTDTGTTAVHGAPNQDPTFDQDLPNRADTTGTVISLDAGATDPNGDPLIYAAANLPAGLSIGAGTGLISGTISAGAVASSPYAVSITVRDGVSVDATDTFTWTVAPAAPAGSITFRAASSASNATATTLVLPAPAGIVAGDVLLASVAARGGPAISSPAGWTLVRLDPNGSTLRQAIFVRVAGGAEPASYTFTLSSAQSATGGIVAYSGVDSANPIDVAGGQVNLSSVSISAPSVTTSGLNRRLVGFFATAVLTSVSPPAGQAERFDQAVPSTNTFKITAEAADQAVAAAGATGTRLATSANAGVNVGQLVALRPAP